MSPRRPRWFGYFGITVLSAVALLPIAAHSVENTWNAVPGTNDFNRTTNWTPAAIPTDIAAFNTSTQTSINITADVALNQFQFNLGASAYSFTVDRVLTFNGVGIINPTSNAQTITTSNGAVTFNNASTAGNATINVNAGILSFNDNSTADHSTIIVGSSGQAQFSSNASSANARIINNGATVAINVNSSLGSIEGIGAFGLLGKLTVGSNNLSTSVSG